MNERQLIFHAMIKFLFISDNKLLNKVNANKHNQGDKRIHQDPRQAVEKFPSYSGLWAIMNQLQSFTYNLA